MNAFTLWTFPHTSAFINSAPLVNVESSPESEFTLVYDIKNDCYIGATDKRDGTMAIKLGSIYFFDGEKNKKNEMKDCAWG